jgi:hypothetical protein
MLRAAAAVGLVAVLLISVAFAFFLTELEFVVDAGGDRVVVCKLPSIQDDPFDRYAIGFARGVAWATGRKLRVESPTSNYVGVTTIDLPPSVKGPTSATFPAAGPTATKGRKK